MRFGYLIKLIELNLSGNQLKEINENTFQSLSNLKRLGLEEHQFRKVSSILKKNNLKNTRDNCTII